MAGHRRLEGYGHEDRILLFQSVAGSSRSRSFAGLRLRLLETVLCKCMTVLSCLHGHMGKGSAALSHCSVTLLFWAGIRGSETRLQVPIAQKATGREAGNQSRRAVRPGQFS